MLVPRGKRIRLSYSPLKWQAAIESLARRIKHALDVTVHRMAPIRTTIVGPPSVATSISAFGSTALMAT
jgi:hypothetical protein